MVVGAFVGVVVVVARHRVALNVCHEGLRTDSFKKQPGGLEGDPVLPDAGMTGHRIVRGGRGGGNLQTYASRRATHVRIFSVKEKCHGCTMSPNA